MLLGVIDAKGGKLHQKSNNRVGLDETADKEFESFGNGEGKTGKLQQYLAFFIG